MADPEPWLRMGIGALGLGIFVFLAVSLLIPALFFDFMGLLFAFIFVGFLLWIAYVRKFVRPREPR